MMTEEDRQLRAAAENLLSNSLESQRGSYVQRSISSINRDYIISEDLIAGTRHNGRMSSTRRFFCLLVTFDLLFTCLMWLICTTIAGESISTAFVQQVLQYRIKTSLFDIVMTAVCRFTFLLLFYACLNLNHWIVVAFTTASTCAFLGAKAYFFNWTGVPQPGFQALLILMSFVLAWSEAWYFDCRVIPQEMQARDWLLSPADNERAPLLRHIFEGPPSRMGESMGNFFTPMDSPTHSDTEEDHIKGPSTMDEDILIALQSVSVLAPEKATAKFVGNRQPDSKYIAPYRSWESKMLTNIEEYKVKVAELVGKSYELLTSNEWKQLNTTSSGDVVSIMSRSYGKIIKIEAIVKVPADSLIDCLHNNVEDLPSWNDEVVLAKKIQTIDAMTDITYQATKPYGAGLIGPRDFVTLRHRHVYGQYHISSGISVHINLPPRKNYIRAENGIVCVAAENFTDEETGRIYSRVTWILNTNLKGWLPQKIIDASVAGILEKTIGYLRSYVHRIPDLCG